MQTKNVCIINFLGWSYELSDGTPQTHKIYHSFIFIFNYSFSHAWEWDPPVSGDVYLADS
jgi:hypothetical protein